MHKYILAIDQGTTGTTALIFDAELRIAGRATQEFPQHFPQPSWVEHDLEEIWRSVVKAVSGAVRMAGVKANEIAAIGITNQRETTCLWRRGEGAKPLGRAIVWQDRRTASDCEKLRRRGLEKWINRKTGLLLDPYFSGTKLTWMLKHFPGAMSLAKRGAIIFGTIESYLLYRMTGEHRTEVTNASRTLLMDIRQCNWDDELLRLFKVPRAILPEIFPSAVEYGRTKGFLDFPDGLPVTGLAGDQQAALFGQACFAAGAAKCTYGTGAFILANTGSRPIFSRQRLLTTIAWKFGNEVTYGLEGSAFIAGAAVQWLRDGLKVIDKSPEIEKLAASVTDSDGVVFVPALSGLGAPHWLPGATGLFTGITRRTSSAHIARAVLEGIAFQVRELLEAMAIDFGRRLTQVRVDGGASTNGLLMQFQADLLGIDVVRSEISETTALGSGLQAGLAIGFWSSTQEIAKKWRASDRFIPGMKPVQRKALIRRWDKAIRAVTLLAKD